jgi:hypothetical protein
LVLRRWGSCAAPAKAESNTVIVNNHFKFFS